MRKFSIFAAFYTAFWKTSRSGDRRHRRGALCWKAILFLQISPPGLPKKAWTPY